MLEQVLTGKFADGLGNVQNVPERVDFDPFPWYSMAVWILTQMKRWGYVKGEVKYKDIAEKVFLLTDAKKHMAELGMTSPAGLREVQGHGQGVRPGQGRTPTSPASPSQKARHEHAHDHATQAQGGAAVAAAVAASRRVAVCRRRRGVDGQRRRRRRRPSDRVRRADGQGRGAEEHAAFRTPAQVGQAFVEYLSDPFYDKGPNDKGIGIQLGYSLARVGLGFPLAALRGAAAGLS